MSPSDETRIEDFQQETLRPEQLLVLHDSPKHSGRGPPAPHNRDVESPTHTSPARNSLSTEGRLLGAKPTKVRQQKAWEHNPVEENIGKAEGRLKSAAGDVAHKAEDVAHIAGGWFSRTLAGARGCLSCCRLPCFRAQRDTEPEVEETHDEVGPWTDDDASPEAEKENPWFCVRCGCRNVRPGPCGSCGVEPTPALEDAEPTEPDDRSTSRPEEVKEVLEEFITPSPEEIQEAVEELFAALKVDDAERVKLLLALRTHGIPLLTANVRHSSTGETAGIFAARHSSLRSCIVLLDNGADPLARDADRKFYGDDYGLWPEEPRPDQYGRKKAQKQNAVCGRTVVYHLRIAGLFDDVMRQVFPLTRVKVVRALASALATFYGENPVMVATRLGYSKLMALLLANVVALPPSTEPKEPKAPQTAPALMFSQRTLPGRVAPHPSSPSTLGKRTLDKDGTVSQEAFGLKGERAEALLAACSDRQWAVAEILLAAGVSRHNIDMVKDKHGRTPLHISCMFGEAKIVQMMLEIGASTSIFSRFGRQPLHDACAAGHSSVVKALVANGVDVNVRVGDDLSGTVKLYSVQDTGLTPLELAQLHGHDQVTQIFDMLQKQHNNGQTIHNEFAADSQRDLIQLTIKPNSTRYH